MHDDKIPISFSSTSTHSVRLCEQKEPLLKEWVWNSETKKYEPYVKSSDT